MRKDSALDRDFAAYLAARWPTLVRTLVLLGAPQPAAQAATRSSLAHCHRRWSQLRETDDLDVEVYRTLLESWAQLRRKVPDAVGGLPGEDDAVAGLTRELDRLTPDVRAALVLSLVADLDEAQVSAVLDARARVETAPGHDQETFRDAADGIEVLAPPPLPDLVAEAGGRHRRSLWVGAAVAAGLLVALGLATWLGTQSTTPATQDTPRVTRVENTAEVAWWANGVLHLAHVDIELPRVVGLVDVDDGAVCVDDRGTVFFVADDGAVTALGRADPGQAVVGSDDTGWAAWVDPTGPTPELVVYDVTAREVLLRRALPPEVPGSASHPIALDRDTVYYEDANGQWQWQVPDGVPEKLRRTGLVDAAQATLVWQRADDLVQMAQPFFSVSFTRPGRGGQLSPTAAYLLTRKPGAVAGERPGTVRIYDTRSGDLLWDGLRRGDIAVATALGPYDEVHYVIARTQLPGLYQFRTCHIGQRSCFTVLKFPDIGEVPVLAPGSAR